MKNGKSALLNEQKREVTSPEELRRILEKCQILRIGAMDEEGSLAVYEEMFVFPRRSTMVLSGRTGTPRRSSPDSGKIISIRQRKAGKLMPSARIQMWPSSWTVVTR